MSSLTVSYLPSSQSGFTLLELVLVMFIIALVASTPLLFIDEQDQQLRYEETREKLATIRHAIYQRESYRGQPLLSGFVVDNGTLPPADELNPLFNLPTGWFSATLSTPYFNFTTDASNAVALSDMKLSKGHRNRYIFSGLDSNNEYLDGWGQAFAVDSSHALGTSSAGLEMGNGVAFNTTAGDLATAYAGSTPRIDVTDKSWQVPLSSLNILLQNYDTSEAIDSSDFQRLAVLVFRNSTDASSSPAEAWTTYHFDIAVSNAPSAGTAATQSSPSDITSWNKNGLSATNSDFLPAGEHPVIVFNGNDTNYSDDEIYIKERLLVFPQSNQPNLTLTVTP